MIYASAELVFTLVDIFLLTMLHLIMTSVAIWRFLHVVYR